ncbi:MAG: hypothetical protein M1319_03735, partial [Chloroflexi bacterium]|nr:hypothetical protein [Chloroflexota bacterium]
MIERSWPYHQPDQPLPTTGGERNPILRRQRGEHCGPASRRSESSPLLDLLTGAARSSALSPDLLSELTLQIEELGRRAAQSGTPGPALGEFSALMLQAGSRVAGELLASDPKLASQLLGNLNIVIAGCWTAFTRGYLSQVGE